MILEKRHRFDTGGKLEKLIVVSTRLLYASRGNSGLKRFYHSGCRQRRVNNLCNSLSGKYLSIKVIAPVLKFLSRPGLQAHIHFDVLAE